MTVHVNEGMVDTLCRLVEGELPLVCEGVGGGRSCSRKCGCALMTCRSWGPKNTMRWTR